MLQKCVYCATVQQWLPPLIPLFHLSAITSQYVSWVRLESQDYDFSIIELKDDYHTCMDVSPVTICCPQYGFTHLAIRIQNKQKKCEHHSLELGLMWSYYAQWLPLQQQWQSQSWAGQYGLVPSKRPHLPVEGHLAQNLDKKRQLWSLWKAGDTAKVDIEWKEELSIVYSVLLLQLYWQNLAFIQT